jgi:predicted small secreted protein
MNKLIVFIIALTISGCGTISGIGKDISSTADWTKEKISGSK